MKNEFVGGGFQNWLKGQDAKACDTVQDRLANGKRQRGIFGKIQLWLHTELTWLRRSKEEKEKSSPRILW